MRSPALAITVLLYGLCTGLSGFSTGIADFCVYGFVTGLGVGGVFGRAATRKRGACWRRCVFGNGWGNKRATRRFENAENAKRELTTDYPDNTDKKWVLGCKNWRRSIGRSAMPCSRESCKDDTWMT
ncbi:MAG TPA: hypothetical protein VMR33_18420 [Candidatus Baltobacteraceae bacterium]|jgi:hypothetical protein|nr:hypothetical protein [Candidatus Baltobacteraceae bacterium]